MNIILFILALYLGKAALVAVVHRWCRRRGYLSRLQAAWEAKKQPEKFRKTSKIYEI